MGHSDRAKLSAHEANGIGFPSVGRRFLIDVHLALLARTPVIRPHRLVKENEQARACACLRELPLGLFMAKGHKIIRRWPSFLVSRVPISLLNGVASRMYLCVGGVWSETSGSLEKLKVNCLPNKNKYTMKLFSISSFKMCFYCQRWYCKRIYDNACRYWMDQ